MCKNNGLILIMGRGASYIPMYNMWLKFKAARDLMEYGLVEHLDFEDIIEKEEGFEIVHKERKNMGMTYIYIINNNKEKKQQEN